MGYSRDLFRRASFGLMTSALALTANPVRADDVPASNITTSQIRPDGSETISAQQDGTSRMTVAVAIGQQGPFRFLIDTGAQRSVLSHNVANRLSLRAINQATVMSVAGSRDVDLVDVDAIQLGRRAWKGKGLPVLEESHLGADGIIGLDGLQGQKVQLDFRRNQITLAASREEVRDTNGYEIVVSARQRHGELILTDADIDGVKVQVVIDTGADISVGNRALQRALGHMTPANTTHLQGVTGQIVPADIGYGKQLSVDRITIRNVELAYTDSKTFSTLGLEKKPAVLLGMPALRLFDRVAIDFATRRVMFDMPDGL
ncbi:peptidase A2A [Novosphingobium umbonatum]|uniref:Peptidase A2A n=2 Tax=Novosphingobium umbonatum TaxID=1908524 RepID=A0A437N0I2_9SPHN|nr:peptidase A2A [Novosphingobium umbonatum]